MATDKNKLLVYKLGGSDQVRQFYGVDNDSFSNPRCLWHPTGYYVYCTGQDNAVHVVRDCLRSQRLAVLCGLAQLCCAPF